MSKSRIVPPGGGAGYDWSADHTFVKVGAEDTNGASALMEDNLRSGFALGLHRHDHHAETFYVLERSIDFHVNGEWTTAETGTCIHPE